MLAVDAKSGADVGPEIQAEGLQGDNDRSREWAKTWQVESNVEICEIIHFGRKEERFLNGEELKGVGGERDLMYTNH